jgi:hypothetical protein
MRSRVRSENQRSSQAPFAQVALRDGDGGGVLVRELVETGAAEVLEPVRVRELIGEAHGQRVVVGEVAAEERDLGERGRGNGRAQEQRHRPGQGHAHLHLVQAHLHTAAPQDAIVRGEGEDAAAGHGVAADRGHHRLGQGVERPHRLREEPHEALHGRPVVFDEGDEVEPGTEQLRVRGREEHAAHARVRPELPGDLQQLLRERLVDRVPARLVEARGDEAPRPLQPNAAHETS